jgi:hypothetical protein
MQKLRRCIKGTTGPLCRKKILVGTSHFRCIAIKMPQISDGQTTGIWPKPAKVDCCNGQGCAICRVLQECRSLASSVKRLQIQKLDFFRKTAASHYRYRSFSCAENIINEMIYCCESNDKHQRGCFTCKAACSVKIVSIKLSG